VLSIKVNGRSIITKFSLDTSTLKESSKAPMLPLVEVLKFKTVFAQRLGK
jgi:hypothetical protein